MKCRARTKKWNKGGGGEREYGNKEKGNEKESTSLKKKGIMIKR